MKAHLFLSLLLSTAVPSSAERLDFVPRQFQGTWSTDPKRCDRSAESMRILARTVVLRGQEGRIHVVVAHGRFEAALVAEIPGRRPARLWARSFELAKDETRMTDVTRDDREIWFKCPSKTR